MAYFGGQWSLNSRVAVFGSYSCTVNFMAGGAEYKGITIGENGTYYIAENGDSERPDEEYETDVIDFGDGVSSTSIDTGFCDAFMMRFFAASADAEIIGIEPSISISGEILQISAKDEKADSYKLYVDGKKYGEFPIAVAEHRIDLSTFIPSTDGVLHTVNVTACFKDDVFLFGGEAILFESAMSNTVVYPLDIEDPDESEEPTEKPTEEDEYIMRGSTLKSIANAIRAMRGTNDPIDALDFAQEILQIDSGDGTRVTTTALDFTDYERGSFTETLSNGLVLTHTIIFDGDTPIWVDNIDVRGV